MFPECRSDLFAFILPQKTGIYKNSHQLITDGFIDKRREGTVAAPRQYSESLRHACDAIAVRHPYFGNLIEHGAAHRWLDLGGTIFALRGWVHLPAERVCQCLHSIAYPKDWQARFEDEVLNIGRALFV